VILFRSLLMNGTAKSSEVRLAQQTQIDIQRYDMHEGAICAMLLHHSGSMYTETLAINPLPNAAMHSCTRYPPTHLFPIPHPRDLGMPHLLLQLEDTEHQRLRCRRAARDVDINRDNTIASSRHRVAVVVVSTTVRAAAH